MMIFVLLLVGGLIGWLVRWLCEVEKEKYFKRLIEHGSLHLRSIMSDMMNTRRAQEESKQSIHHSWSEGMRDEERDYREKQQNKYDELRKAEKEAAEKNRDVVYPLPPPPESLQGNICPEDWLFEMQKKMGGEKNTDMRTFLPWFREMIMTGYTNGKETGFKFAAAQRKGKKK
jgi:hypothetical protein